MHVIESFICNKAAHGVIFNQLMVLFSNLG